MINLKLKTVAALVDKDDVVIDVGCDHAYLAIYLKQNNLCKEVYASEISENALNIANENIKNSGLRIKTFLSDGFKNIFEKSIDTAIIAGMGTTSALDIVLNAPRHVKKFIISSNNNHSELRNQMYQYGYYVQKELVINENGIFYPIMVFTRDFQKESKYTLNFGKSGNAQYFEYLRNKENEILAKIPKTDFITRYKHQKNIEYLTKIDKGIIK